MTTEPEHMALGQAAIMVEALGMPTRYEIVYAIDKRADTEERVKEAQDAALGDLVNGGEVMDVCRGVSVAHVARWVGEHMQKNLRGLLWVRVALVSPAYTWTPRAPAERKIELARH